jgi:hypothetical protein
VAKIFKENHKKRLTNGIGCVTIREGKTIPNPKERNNIK